MKNRSVPFHGLEKLINDWPVALNSAHFLLDRSQKKCSDSERSLISIELLKFSLISLGYTNS